VLYLNLATIFAAAFSLVWELNPAAFANLAPPTGGPGELAAVLYFSLTTLTTTGCSDIAVVDPFARSLANLESVLGQFYLAITVARLVTLDWQIGAANLRCQPDPHAACDDGFSTQSNWTIKLGGTPNVATFCPFPGRCDADRRHFRNRTTRVCRFSVCAILPAGLRLPAAEFPSALRGGNSRAPSGRGKRRGWGRPYRGDFGQCRAGRCNRGRFRRSPRCSTPGFGAQCGRMLLKQRSSCRGPEAVRQGF
jgi:hypothetical protein